MSFGNNGILKECRLESCSMKFILLDRDRLARENFLLNVNSLDRNITFTLEIEKDASFPFLCIHLHRNNQMPSHTVYRNPPFNANLFFHYRIEAFKYVIQSGFFFICSGTQLKQELYFIKQVALNHNFPINYIYKIIHKHKHNNHFTHSLHNNL